MSRSARFEWYGLRTARRLRWLLGAVLCVLDSGALAARMYQWTDPQTGSLQLSGHPPPWFRSSETGPRVRVFERGIIIDDTAYPAAPTPAPPPPAPSPAPPSPAAAPTANAPMPPATDPRTEFKALLEAWDREQSARALRTPRPAGNDSAVSAPPAQ